MISFQSVTKQYNKRNIFDKLSLTIESGEMVAIMGSSGAGKSSLIHMLLGEIVPDSGSVLIDGYDISHLPSASVQLMRRSIGVVFQDFSLLPQKNIFENIAYVMEICEMTDAEIEERVPQVLRQVHLHGVENKFPHQLSGGEQQRVAIARALAHTPKLLIADEPTGNLDGENTLEITKIFQELHQDSDMTIIIATHSNAVITALRPRIIRIENGKAV